MNAECVCAILEPRRFPSTTTYLEEQPCNGAYLPYQEKETNGCNTTLYIQFYCAVLSEIWFMERDAETVLLRLL